ncbi:MAG: hypothetical protein RI955_2020, partial [Bacteroidota bacterium]
KDRFRNIELTYVFALKMLMDEITLQLLKLE